MSRLLITAVCAAMAFPTVSAADDHGHAARPPAYQYGGGPHRDQSDGRHDNGGGGHQYQDGGRYPYYGSSQRHYNNGAYRYYSYGGYRPNYYGNRYPYYYYGHGHHDSNDDALWAIGGLVVGAIIGSAVERASTPPPARTSAPPAPASQPQKYCDRIEYDSAGNPYVERSCNR